jgi:hypothetical protein
MAKFRAATELHDWLPGSLVLTAVVEQFGAEQMLDAG